jgi:hypothetical protein
MGSVLELNTNAQRILLVSLLDNSNYYDLDPSPSILILRIILFSHKKVSLMVIVSIKVYKRNI